ncbi:chitin deacetylase 8-like [Anticarsia gemmatalis]|uniref:chitin deacetylase 8-like n=1 Tax=Anticarsia gemmatalis TaxID=129554 RepID=UPI003F771F72
MKWFAFLFLPLVLAKDLKGFNEIRRDVPLAVSCDVEACQLPDCRCSSTDIPGGLLPRDTPQFVTITFDDPVNPNNIEIYREILYNRKNSNGCPAGATFYVNHEWNDYRLVNELYNQQFEIALHTISHNNNASYWAGATYDIMEQELGHQRKQMAHFANIPYESLQGVRLPHLQMTGNSSFLVMADYGVVYDCSWPTMHFTNPGLWPYTLDYATTQECLIPPCPTASIPGTWVMPMVSWFYGGSCAMVDYCDNSPDVNDEEAWFRFIVKNFEIHYLGNRAPFGFFVHDTFLAANPAVKAALIRFMDLVNHMHDAFMVNSIDVINWVKNPISLQEYRNKGCNPWKQADCQYRICGPMDSEHNNVEYWMHICNVCPRIYPWLGNPLGI